MSVSIEVSMIVIEQQPMPLLVLQNKVKKVEMN